MLQSIVVDAVVLAAAAWLVWTFAPASLRSLVTRKPAVPSYDAALQADELAGQQPPTTDCGCGAEKSCH